MRVSKCVCFRCYLVKLPQDVFQHMLGEFAQDSDFVVWSPGVADFGNQEQVKRIEQR